MHLFEIPDSQESVLAPSRAYKAITKGTRLAYSRAAFRTTICLRKFHEVLHPKGMFAVYGMKLKIYSLP